MKKLLNSIPSFRSVPLKISRETVKNYLIVIIGIGIIRGVAFLNSVMLARLLGPSQFGVYAVFQIIMILTWQFSQAFDTSFVRYAKTSRSEIEEKSFLKSTVLIKFIYITVVLIISYPLSIFLVSIVFEKPDLFLYVIIALACGCFISFSITVSSFYQVKGRFIIYLLVNSIFTMLIFFVIASNYAISTDVSLDVLVKTFLVIALFIGMGSLIFLITKVGNFLYFEKNTLLKSFSLSKWIIGVSLVFFVFQRIDTMFLSRLVDLKLVGVYFAATQVVMVVGLLSGPLSSVFLPMASVALESKESLLKYIKESLFAVCVVNTFVLILFYFSPTILRFAYGAEYEAGSSAMRILLIGWFFWIIYQPFSYLFYTLEDSKTRFVMEFSKLAIAVLLLLLLVRSHGMLGAAIAISLASFSNTIISGLVLYNKLRKTYRILILSVQKVL